MNDYATKITWYGGTTILLLLTLQMWVAHIVARNRTGRARYISLALVSLATLFIWFLVSAFFGFFFGFCSGCFGPGTPQWRAFYGTFGWPNSSFLGIPLLFATLYLLALAHTTLLTRLKAPRYLFLVTAPIIAALIVGGIITNLIARINADPNGIFFPIPDNAQNIQDTHTTEPPYRLVQFDTSSQPQDVLTYYQRVLPDEDWVPLTKLPTGDANQDTYWRVSSANRDLYLIVKVEPTTSGRSNVRVQLSMSRGVP